MQPNTDNPVQGQLPTMAQMSGGELGDQLPFKILPIIEQAQEAFHRSLPQLLRERSGQWVAYHGDHLIGFARTDIELYQECLRLGFAPGEFLIRSIEPEADEVSFSSYPID